MANVEHWSNLSCRQISFEVHATEVYSNAAASKTAHRCRGEPVM